MKRSSSLAVYSHATKRNALLLPRFHSRHVFPGGVIVLLGGGSIISLTFLLSPTTFETLFSRRTRRTQTTLISPRSPTTFSPTRSTAGISSRYRTEALLTSKSTLRSSSRCNNNNNNNNNNNGSRGGSRASPSCSCSWLRSSEDWAIKRASRWISARSRRAWL
jgi:hypothetical protein